VPGQGAYYTSTQPMFAPGTNGWRCASLPGAGQVCCVLAVLNDAYGNITEHLGCSHMHH